MVGTASCCTILELREEARRESTSVFYGTTNVVFTSFAKEIQNNRRPVPSLK